VPGTGIHRVSADEDASSAYEDAYMGESGSAKPEKLCGVVMVRLAAQLAYLYRRFRAGVSHRNTAWEPCMAMWLGRWSTRLHTRPAIEDP